MELIDIKRAIELDRKITFVRAIDKELIYTTAFGEEFPIKINRLPKDGIEKTALGIDFVTSMVIYNLDLEKKGEE